MNYFLVTPLRPPQGGIWPWSKGKVKLANQPEPILPLRACTELVEVGHGG